MSTIQFRDLPDLEGQHYPIPSSVDLHKSLRGVEALTSTTLSVVDASHMQVRLSADGTPAIFFGPSQLTTLEKKTTDSVRMIIRTDVTSGLGFREIDQETGMPSGSDTYGVRWMNESNIATERYEHRQYMVGSQPIRFHSGTDVKFKVFKEVNGLITGAYPQTSYNTLITSEMVLVGAIMPSSSQKSIDYLSQYMGSNPIEGGVKFGAFNYASDAIKLDRFPSAGGGDDGSYLLFRNQQTGLFELHLHCPYSAVVLAAITSKLVQDSNELIFGFGIRDEESSTPAHISYLYPYRRVGDTIVLQLFSPGVNTSVRDLIFDDNGTTATVGQTGLGGLLPGFTTFPISASV